MDDAAGTAETLTKTMLAKRWMRVAGYAAGAAGLVFVGYQLYAMRAAVARLLADPALLLPIVGGSALYALALGLLGIAWVGLLGRQHVNAPTLRRALFGAFAATSIGKYLPGNIMHFAGRQAMAAQHDIPQTRIAAASLGESLCTMAAALLLAVIALIGISTPAAWLPLVAAALILSALPARRAPVAGAILLGLLFFLINQLLLGWLLQPLAVGDGAFLPISFAYLLAWAAGNLVPGAPGGLGVREAAFIALADGAGIAAPAAVLSIAIAMRIISTLGDVLFFGYGLWLARTPQTNPSESL